MSWELLVPIAVLAIVIALVRAFGVLVAKPKSTQRVYTKPVISGSWGQRQNQTQPEQNDTPPREQNA